MIKSDFNRLWDETIVRLAEDFKKKYPHVEFDISAKEQVFKVYDDLKNRVHTYMQQDGMLIDRHKIAAILTFTLLNSSLFKPISLPTEKILTIEYMANEYLAIAVSLAVMRSFIIKECENSGNMDRKSWFEKNYVFPESTHCNYFIALVRNLYYSRLNKSVDVFTLANLFFMIESYTELFRKQEMFLNLDPSKIL